MRKSHRLAFALSAICLLAAGAPAADAPHRGEGGVPRFVEDPTWPKVPAQWTGGASISDVKADAQGNIWLISRPGKLPSTAPRASLPPAIMVFDPGGTFLRGWGGDHGATYRWPSHEHDVEIDAKGFVWVVGSAMLGRQDEHGDALVPDSQVLKFTRDGKFVMAIGKAGQDGSNRTDVLKGAAGLSYYAPANELFVADGYGNNRIVVYDADTGRLKRSWGAYGGKPLDKADRRPAALPAGARPAPGIFGPLAERLQQFETVHDVAVSKDGYVYVADRGNRRVQVFRTDGAFVAEQLLGYDTNYDLQARGIAFSPDERFLYVSGTPGIYILNRRTLEVLDTVLTGPANEHPVGHHIGTDAQGNIYLTFTGIFDAGANGGKTFGVRKYRFTGYSPTTPCCQPVRRMTVADGFPSKGAGR